MDCWEILGIEYGADRRAIKSAYAKLLKVNRPEDDPEAFNELHEAYQEALAHEAGGFQVSIDSSLLENIEWDEDEDTSESSQELSEVEDEPCDEPEDRFQEEGVLSGKDAEEFIRLVESSYETKESVILQESERKDGALLLEKIGALLKKRIDRWEIDNWKFIEEIPSMDSIGFKRVMSDQVFVLIAELNAKYRQSLFGKISLRLSPPVEDHVVTYLGKLFGWEVREAEYRETMDEELVEAVFSYFDP